jgi:hypothetical protein
MCPINATKLSPLFQLPARVPFRKRDLHIANIVLSITPTINGLRGLKNAAPTSPRNNLHGVHSVIAEATCRHVSLAASCTKGPPSAEHPILVRSDAKPVHVQRHQSSNRAML